MGNQALRYSQVKLLPYEEVEIIENRVKNDFTLITPWLSCDFMGDNRKVSKIKVLLGQNKRSSNKTTVDKRIDKFTQNFAQYPIYYVLPRKLKKSKEQIETWSKESLSSILRTRELIKMAEDNNQRLFPNEEWKWDIQDILNRSRLANSHQYDPYSVYTALRRNKLLDECNPHLNKTQALFAKLKILLHEDETKFFQLIALILSQQYYVTSRCVESLSPAIAIAGEAKTSVVQYIKEELHHDKLVLQSIRAIQDTDVSSDLFLNQTKVCMSLLRSSASFCFLAFCCLVNCFEGNGYSDADPLAELLKISTKPESFKGIHKHFLINKLGNHHAIGEKFVQFLPPVSQDEVIAAARITELMSKLQLDLSKQILNWKI